MSDKETVEIEYVIYPEGADDQAVRVLVAGEMSFFLLEPVHREDGSLQLSVTASMVGDDIEETTALLSAMVNGVEQAVDNDE